MLGSKTWHDRIIHKVDADIFEPKSNDIDSNHSTTEMQIKQEKIDNVSNSGKDLDIQPMDVSDIKSESNVAVPLSLEEQAAQEIIEDLKTEKNKITEPKVFKVVLNQDDDLLGREQVSFLSIPNILSLDFILLLLNKKPKMYNFLKI